VTWLYGAQGNHIPSIVESALVPITIQVQELDVRFNHAMSVTIDPSDNRALVTLTVITAWYNGKVPMLLMVMWILKLDDIATRA